MTIENLLKSKSPNEIKMAYRNCHNIVIDSVPAVEETK